jgi:7-carboxy-7-deazaguanine synthase
MKKKITDRSVETEISEIFSSLQGEGPYLGMKQVFVRFGRCNMHCHYCDELPKMEEEFFDVRTLDETVADIEKLEKEKGAHHSISLTGGEPLFYPQFLRNFLPRLKEKGFTTYLETNGTLPRELESVIKWVDIIAMDLKPPTSTNDRAFWKEHEAFLRIALQKDVFVKTVITQDVTMEDVEQCVALLKNTNPKIPFIFQPLTAAFGIDQKALDLIEKKFFNYAKENLTDVRVIPQMHKIWGVR